MDLLSLSPSFTYSPPPFYSPPFAPGAQHNFERNLIKVAWTPDGKHVGCGSADRNVYVWNYASTAIEYCLPGHKGSVNGIAFHPKEPIGT